MKELSVEEQIYLCKYHDVDKDLKFTIGLNENEVKETIYKLKKMDYMTNTENSAKMNTKI